MEDSPSDISRNQDSLLLCGLLTTADSPQSYLNRRTVYYISSITSPPETHGVRVAVTAISSGPLIVRTTRYE